MIHYIPTGAKTMMKEIAKIKLSEMREHMKNNFRCRYFTEGPLGDEVEIAGCTDNFWCYPVKPGSAFHSRKDQDVTVKKEVQE